MRSPASRKRPKFPVSSSDTTCWQLPDSIIPRTSSSEPCPPSTYCSTITRASVPNSLYQGLTFSGLTGAQLLGLSPLLADLTTILLVSRFQIPAPPRFL
ncbi:hypothetical protein CHARACLAT_006956 [Characodon lateralis]|uniref:Uncharacterized protein n=1 Tax=Characodon lateralis TaxID=208331 RepID=A0ABU7ERU2_9TELE|nr:hypothetical protein [Characodon lateralis]